MSVTLVFNGNDSVTEPVSAASEARRAAAQKYGDRIRSLRVSCEGATRSQSEDNAPRSLSVNGSLYPLLSAYLQELDEIDAQFAAPVPAAAAAAVS